MKIARIVKEKVAFYLEKTGFFVVPKVSQVSVVLVLRFFQTVKKRVFSHKVSLWMKKEFAISIKLQSNFIEITLRHGCPPVNLLYIFKTLFPKNTSGWQFLVHFNTKGIRSLCL